MICRRNAIRVLTALALARNGQAQSAGPYCWTGKRPDGEDAYIPCRDLGLTTGSLARWIDLDLAGVAGIRVRTELQVLELPVAEILSAVKHCVCLEPHARP